MKATLSSYSGLSGAADPLLTIGSEAAGESELTGMTGHIQSMLEQFPVIYLEEMSEIKLMNRVDRKFMVAASDLPEIIGAIQQDYFVQEIGGKRISSYSTTYLDTENLQFFLTHVNGKLNRFKWRIRSYDDSDISFLEMKSKNNKGRTKKSRIEFTPFTNLSEGVAYEFIRAESGLEPAILHPALRNRFQRITFVNREKTERITVDFNISFFNSKNGRSFAAGNLCIMEIKQDKSCHSFLNHILNERKIKKSGVSKYCLGIALTTDNIKINSYKRKIRHIHKITSKV